MHTHTRSMAVPAPGALFRTRTGQTGRDAYLNEATAIANEKRELDARFRKLLEAVRAESPDTFQYRSDYAFACSESADAFADYVRKHA